MASSARRLLPIVVAYLPVPVLGAIGSARWNVGASPDGGARDMFLRGTALTPPLFLPAVLLGGAAAARRDGRAGRLGAAVVSVVATLFLAGSTANLPNDFAAARAAGTPLPLTAGLAAIHLALSLALLYNALPTVRGRGGIGSEVDLDVFDRVGDLLRTAIDERLREVASLLDATEVSVVEGAPRGRGTAR